MHKTKNDLPEGTRSKVVDLLAPRLADGIDLKLQAKQAHWNVKGPNFIALHQLFDKLTDEIDDWVDDMAERIAALGGVAEGTLQAVSKRSTLAPYSLALSDGRDHLDALSSAMAAFAKQVRAAIDAASELKDADTADLFTGISRDADKQLWFLEAHLQTAR